MKTSATYAGHCTWPEFQQHLRSSRGVIVVCGSCEQHGHHLPLDTDNIIGEELALRIAEKTGGSMEYEAKDGVFTATVLLNVVLEDAEGH